MKMKFHNFCYLHIIISITTKKIKTTSIMNLDTLKKSILEDGKIDANEVAQIRELI